MYTSSHIYASIHIHIFTHILINIHVYSHIRKCVGALPLRYVTRVAVHVIALCPHCSDAYLNAAPFH